MKIFSQFKMFVMFPLMHVVTLYGIWNSDNWPVIITIGLLLYYPLMNFGQAIGYHKMFCHKSFEPKAWFPYFSAFIGSISLFGDPLRSVMLHRLHHKYADDTLDPHSPRHGRFHAYIGWLYSYVPPENERYIVIDVIRKYPWTVSFSKWEFLIPYAFHSCMFLISTDLFLTIMLGVLVTMQVALLNNAFSHDPSITARGPCATDNIFLAKYINPVFLHKQHHDIPYKWNYSDPNVNDFTAKFIVKFLAKKVND